MLAISIIALVISAFALPFTAWAARAAAKQAKAARDQTEIQREQVLAAREQTQLQLELARERLQPYVWADIQPDMQQGTLVYVMVGNSGPTVARNVKVTFDPPLPADQRHADTVKRSNNFCSMGSDHSLRIELLAGHLGLDMTCCQAKTHRSALFVSRVMALTVLCLFLRFKSISPSGARLEMHRMVLCTMCVERSRT